MERKEDCFHLGAKALIHNGKGQFLVLELNPEVCRNRKNLWDLPGGRIQRDEKLEDALKREVWEETGLKNLTEIKPFIMALSSIRLPLPEMNVGLIYAAYLCEWSGDEEVKLSHEHLQFRWCDPQEAAQLLSTYPIEITEKIAQFAVIGANLADSR